MVLYANTFSDNDEDRFGIGKVSGAHFYQDIDPENKENRVLKVSTWNTNTNLPSITHVSGNRITASTNSCEFEMKYRFNVIPWLFSTKYFTLHLFTKNDVSLFSVTFEAITANTEGGSASRIALRVGDGEIIEGSEICAEAWYSVRIEYYSPKKASDKAYAKIYLGKCGQPQSLVYTAPCQGGGEDATKAAIIHSSTKIRGVQCFDDISFTLSDNKYTPKASPAIPREKKKIYDFESGIPSDRSFNIEMQLKKGDERATFDPSTWKTLGLSSSFKGNGGFYEISLVLRGEGSFVTDAREYPFTEGTIFVTSPGINHRVVSEGGYKLLSVMGQFEKLGFIEDVCILNDNIYSEGKKLAELILYNRFGNEDYAEALCEAYVKYIISNIDRPPKSTTAAIYKIISSMEKNFDKSDLSVGKLLDASGYARDYIREEFFAVTKQTPKKYLNEIRMKNAKAMIDLYGTELSLGEIAERCGIVDSSVFSRIFRKHFGISPTEYRNTKR